MVKEEGKKGAKREENKQVLIIEIARLVEQEKATEEEMVYVFSEAERTQAKAEDDLGQLIACVPYRSSKVQMVWQLHDAYQYVRNRDASMGII